MKTVRFAPLVEQCGRPEIHLLLVEPAKDSSLQKAIREHRVMTLFQPATGHQTDRAEIGFEAGPHRQFLVFPKSLRKFSGARVVGIHYELLEGGEKPAKRSKVSGRKPRKEKAPAKDKVVSFPRSTAPAEEDEEDEDVAGIKTQIRHAMNHLERGRPVAAFNLLKRIAED